MSPSLLSLFFTTTCLFNRPIEDRGASLVLEGGAKSQSMTPRALVKQEGQDGREDNDSAVRGDSGEEQLVDLSSVTISSQ